MCNKKTWSYDVCLLRYGVFAQTIFCHFRPVFAFLPHYWPQKLKFGKNVKKHLDILSFYTCVPLIKIIWFLVPKISSSTDRIFLSSWAFFCPFTPLTPWKRKYQKWKKPWRYHHFTQVYQKSWSSAILFQRYGTCQVYLLFWFWAIWHFSKHFSTTSKQLRKLNLKLSYKTQPHKTPYEILQFQEKLQPLQRNNVQAMLLQSEKVLEINFPAIWRPKIQKISLRFPPWKHFMEIVIYANSKETKSLAKNSCRQKCLDKNLATLFPFTPLTARKMKISKQWQKGQEMSFYTSVPQIIYYTVPEIWHVSDVIVIFRFGQFLIVLPS